MLWKKLTASLQVNVKKASCGQSLRRRRGGGVIVSVRVICTGNQEVWSKNDGLMDQCMAERRAVGRREEEMEGERLWGEMKTVQKSWQESRPLLYCKWIISFNGRVSTKKKKKQMPERSALSLRFPAAIMPSGPEPKKHLYTHTHTHIQTNIIILPLPQEDDSVTFLYVPAETQRFVPLLVNMEASHYSPMLEWVSSNKPINNSLTSA